MKIIILIFCIVPVLFSCKQKTKTTIEKYTDTGIHDTIIKQSFADSVKADSLKKVFQAAANDTIIEGRSIGCIKLNETAEEVIKALGQPDSSDAAMGKSLLRWFSRPTGTGIDTTVNSISIFTSANFGSKDESHKVKQIRITSPFFKTPEQIRCGSTITFIKMGYPALKKPSASYTDKKTGGEILIYDAMKEGIAFEINELTKCIGITVHLPGQKSWEIYLSSLGEVKKL